MEQILSFHGRGSRTLNRHLNLTRGVLSSQVYRGHSLHDLAAHFRQLAAAVQTMAQHAESESKPFAFRIEFVDIQSQAS